MIFPYGILFQSQAPQHNNEGLTDDIGGTFIARAGVNRYLL